MSLSDPNVEMNEVAANEGMPADVRSEIDAYISKIEDAEETQKLDEMKMEETEEVVPDTKVETEAETPEVIEVADDKTKEALDRLFAREEEVRKKELDFDARVSAAIKAKLPDFRGKGPEEVLKLAGLDPDLALKQLMYEKASDTNPVKAKLKEELRDYHTKRELEKMRAELESRDIEAQRKQYFQTVSDGARKHVESVDEKVAPVFSAVAKTKPDYAHQRIMQVIVQDAQTRLARGEDGDPMTYAEAVKAVESELSILAEALKSKNGAANTLSKAAGTPVVTVKKPIVKQARPPTQEEEVQAAIQKALGTYEREERKAKTGR